VVQKLGECFTADFGVLGGVGRKRDGIIVAEILG
jgi:hypothetical protein